MHTYTPQLPTSQSIRNQKSAERKAHNAYRRFERAHKLLTLIITRYEHDHDTYKLEYGQAIAARACIATAMSVHEGTLAVQHIVHDSLVYGPVS